LSTAVLAIENARLQEDISFTQLTIEHARLGKEIWRAQRKMADNDLQSEQSIAEYTADNARLTDRLSATQLALKDVGIENPVTSETYSLEDAFTIEETYITEDIRLKTELSTARRAMNQQKSRLLGLPRELRDKILEPLLIHGTVNPDLITTKNSTCLIDSSGKDVSKAISYHHAHQQTASR
jgi:hypothetical protein